VPESCDWAVEGLGFRLLLRKGNGIGMVVMPDWMDVVDEVQMLLPQMMDC